jgi:hypothetical protein
VLRGGKVVFPGSKTQADCNAAENSDIRQAVADALEAGR